MCLLHFFDDGLPVVTDFSAYCLQLHGDHLEPVTIALRFLFSFVEGELVELAQLSQAFDACLLFFACIIFLFCPPRVFRPRGLSPVFCFLPWPLSLVSLLALRRLLLVRVCVPTCLPALVLPRFLWPLVFFPAFVVEEQGLDD